MDIISVILSIIGSVITKAIPDKDLQTKVMLELGTAQIKADLETAVAQLDVNKAEASSSNLFVAGWRPFLGWVCGIAFTYSIIVLPIIQTILYIYNVHATLPQIDTTTATMIVTGMLGLGGLRTYEKAKGLPSGVVTSTRPKGLFGG